MTLMQMGIYFDQTRCMGCYTCVVACKDWHDIPAGPASWKRVLTIEKGEYPHLFVAFFSTSCYHCADPECIAVCPANALSKRENDGIVIVNKEDCLGKETCGMCLQSCPYNAPQFGAEANAKMQKCDLCFERLEQGLKPICVEACPLFALDAGPLEEIEEKYGKKTCAKGFHHSKKLRPSIVFKPRLKS